MRESMQPGPEQRNAAGSPADKINSVFEMFGGMFILMHILKVLQDKSVAGVSITAVTFFTIFGYWNLYYYKTIQQRWSLKASYLITAANTVWAALLFYYGVFGG